MTEYRQILAVGSRVFLKNMHHWWEFPVQYDLRFSGISRLRKIIPAGNFFWEHHNYNIIFL